MDKAHQNQLECFKNHRYVDFTSKSIELESLEVGKICFSKHLRLFLGMANLSNSRDKGTWVGYRYIDLTDLNEEGM